MHPELRETHPRPQLVRERWTDLNGDWGFAHDDDDTGLDDGWMTRENVFSRTITVPFPPESAASGIHDPEPHPVVWYRRKVQVAKDDLKDGKRTILHFGAVDYAAMVWANGQLVARHEGGHTPFSADITTQLREGKGKTVIVVRAEDDPFDMEMPRGKQDWQTPPHGIWYFRTTGIWQPVWLETVSPTCIASVRWTPNVDAGTLGLRVDVDGPVTNDLAVRVHLSLDGETLADDTIRMTQHAVSRDLELFPGGVVHMANRVLWSPEQPALIDAELTLLRGDSAIDEVLSYAGMRSVTLADGEFRLNNRPYFQRLVLEQGYWPESHLAAPDIDAIRREVELVKELGFNGVRIHQKVEDPRFLYWCDRLGVIVWGEMANAYRFSAGAVERLVREWLEVVRRDYNHPCIVTWVPLNESWGVPSLSTSPEQRAYLRSLYHLTHALDDTRPVITNDGWEHVQSDIWSVHDYSFDGEVIRGRYRDDAALEHTLNHISPGQHPILAIPQARDGEPVMITEYGGVSFAPQQGERWFGYGTVTSLEDYEAKYEELTGAILDSPTISGFCYTQLTDTEQETNGLLTASREPKIDPTRIREINSRPAASIPRETTAAHRKRAREQSS